MPCSLGHSFLPQTWAVARVLRVVFKPRASWQEAERVEPGRTGHEVAAGSPRWVTVEKGLRGGCACYRCSVTRSPVHDTRQPGPSHSV